MSEDLSAAGATAESYADYHPTHPVRFVTAASLFDGHDAAINIFRRLLQRGGAEVVHLGHNRSAEEVVDAALQEDAQGIAVSSYQGGHVEYFRYMKDLLEQKGAPHVRLFGGGGGVIVPDEIRELEAYGIEKIYTPDDGRRMGLEGIIGHMISRSDFVPPKPEAVEPGDVAGRWIAVARTITLAESTDDDRSEFEASLERLRRLPRPATQPVLGITGTGGAGKSCLTDELVRRFLRDFDDKTVAVLSVDPSKRRTGGALLGDRLRMNAVHHERAFMRSLATREHRGELSAAIQDAIEVVKAAGYDLVIVETSGIGQSDAGIVDVCDVPMYVMTSEFGAASQLEKIEMLELADLVAVNKFDRRGSADAFRDVCKQYKRENDIDPMTPNEDLSIYGTMASRFNDEGVNALYSAMIEKIAAATGVDWKSTLEVPRLQVTDVRDQIVPPRRTAYLAEIAESVHRRKQKTDRQSDVARRVQHLRAALDELPADDPARSSLQQRLEVVDAELDDDVRRQLEDWPRLREQYSGDELVVEIRDKEIRNDLSTTSLSGTKVPRVALPRTEDHGELVRFLREENVPGRWPFTGGVFPFKRTTEDPKRQFAGEGPPERTNRRFHYLCLDDPAKRLSTAFDSVTLYGEDPAERPDIYGKVGESGVSICSVDDMKKLYSGFDLSDPMTSVSMTINGPAPIILAMYMNTAIDQACERWLIENGNLDQAMAKRDALYTDQGLEPPRYHGELPKGNDGVGLGLLGISGRDVVPPEVYAELKERTLSTVRGTVQADILKEDQAQNTCIFSVDFALKMMGDIQQYFVDHRVRNYYSVSISGYHIAEAGANPISQLAFTLSNGFTLVEYYLSRGMHIDEVAPNLSFFFSNGLDPEYTVIGRVARRIWATAIREMYGGNERSQKLKYHVQTSGRSLHAREIAFNDIRTTLQALLAMQDNCNSLHTNAYDEAITTPTEESVRRAMAIQLIIAREFGWAKNENPLQGSYFVEQLTDMVEDAVVAEFERISERGGVLGAMETQYQRGRIQEESLLYETRKHTGELPIVGVNTFLDANRQDNALETGDLVRSSAQEKHRQITAAQSFQGARRDSGAAALERLQTIATNGGNVFEELMGTVKVATLGQITHALYRVGGEYRRMM
ncbi:MAG TPA: methylmalonyl-CoA mutase family protein [Candidatus Krumholzibacteria bacterium]|nr:methylmalonyl-CoA mutase family protein [Candidatus Krumholzibacteria bacterium]